MSPGSRRRLKSAIGTAAFTLRRQRSIEECEATIPKLASYLRIEERELEAGRLN